MKRWLAVMLSGLLLLVGSSASAKKTDALLDEARARIAAAGEGAVSLVDMPLSIEQLTTLVAEHPGKALHYAAQWNEVTVKTGDTYFDAGRTPVKSFQQFMAFLALFPSLERVDMFETKLRANRIAELEQAFSHIRFGWTILIKDHVIRTDATAFSTLHSDSSPAHTSKDFEVLKYCTELVALDLGHNRIGDLSFLLHLPKLKILILACNNISDISPMARLAQLEYAELFMNRIEDISPLAGLTQLIDLELARNKIADYMPLMGLTHLQRLKVFKSGKNIPEAELKGALPGCDIDFTTNPTQGTWRTHERYFDIKDIFATGEYHPWTE